MNKQILSLSLIAISWTALTAQAQAPIAVSDDEGSLSRCMEAISMAESAGDSSVDIGHISAECMTQESMALSFFEGMADRLNGPDARPNFGSFAEAIGYLERCHSHTATVSECHEEDDEPAPTPTPTPTPHHDDTPDRVELTCLHGRLETRGGGYNQECVCPEGTERLEGDRNWSHYEGHGPERVERHVRYVVVVCMSTTNPAAPPIAREEIRDWSSDITIITNRLSALEHRTCDTQPGQPGYSEDYARLCRRVTELEREVRLPFDYSRIDVLEVEYTQLVDNDWAICDNGDHHTREEWRELTPDQRVEICGRFHHDALVDRTGEGGSGDSFNHHRFLVSAGLDLAYDGAANTMPVYGSLRAQYEYAITRSAWFYARADGGLGTLNDPANWIGAVPVGDSAYWGVGAGASFDLLPFLTLTVGASYHGLLNPGPYAPNELWGDYRGHRVTGDLGLRLVFNPGDTVRVGAELDLSVGWSRVFGESQGAAVPLDGVTVPGSLRLFIQF